MLDVGLIAEGITDQRVLQRLIWTYFGDTNIPIARLEPEEDETDASRMARPGNWWHVLNYCASENFLEALQFRSHLVIQIDTDACNEYGVNSRAESGEDRTCEELIAAVSDHIIDKIGQDNFEMVANRIVFAICVHSMECWFLPYYYPSDKSKRTKQVSCLETLNPALNKKYGFTIVEKRPDYYQTISKDSFGKKKDIVSAAAHQPSLRRFVDQLDRIDVDQT